MREARANAFLATMHRHDPRAVWVGYCGGCEFCGSREEHVVCDACGWNQLDDPDHPYPYVVESCPTWDAAWHAFVRTIGAEPIDDEIACGRLLIK